MVRKKGILEVHHILPKRLGGTNCIDNLITLCHKCHKKVTNKEIKYIKYFHKILNNEDKKTFKGLNYASHVMVGKNYLRDELKKKGPLYITNGGDTANKRYEWKINKTHSNDAIVITDLKPRRDTIDIKDWLLKPIRRKKSHKRKTDSVLGFKHKDYVSYTYNNGDTYEGYITALYPKIHSLSFKSIFKHCKKVNANRCKLLWRFSNLYWL